MMMSRTRRRGRRALGHPLRFAVREKIALLYRLYISSHTVLPLVSHTRTIPLFTLPISSSSQQGGRVVLVTSPPAPSSRTPFPVLAV